MLESNQNFFFPNKIAREVAKFLKKKGYGGTHNKVGRLIF